MGEILDAVTSEFEVDSDVAESDIIEFLQELEKHQFLLLEDETI